MNYSMLLNSHGFQISREPPKALVERLMVRFKNTVNALFDFSKYPLPDLIYFTQKCIFKIVEEWVFAAFSNQSINITVTLFKSFHKV